MSARTSQIMSLARAARVVPTARSFTTRAAARPALLPRAPAVQSRIASPAFGLRFKSETSTWASKPIIKYEELKPITQQPSDVSEELGLEYPQKRALGILCPDWLFPLESHRSLQMKTVSRTDQLQLSWEYQSKETDIRTSSSSTFVSLTKSLSDPSPAP